MAGVLLETDLKNVGPCRKGKVRDVYDLGDRLLIVATDRLSAFDVVLPTGIEDKGKVLTKLSLFWFRQMDAFVPNHVIEADVEKFPDAIKAYSHLLSGRSLIARKAQVIPFECVVRGYLAGSGWSEYRESGKICGISLPQGLVESAKLPEPIFTPSTKADEGHDMNVSFEVMEKHIGKDLAGKVRALSLGVYEKARDFADSRGIIIADTKFEFGLVDGEILIIDEVLTPDSSRFWSKKAYEPGKPQDSYDKQIVRDYLNTLDWNKQYPGPHLPAGVAEKTRQRYVEILRIISGEGL